MLPDCPLQLSADGEPILPRAFCLGFYSPLKSFCLKTLPPIPSLWFGEPFFACGLLWLRPCGVWKVHPLAFLQSLYPPIVIIHANQEIFRSTSYVPICHSSRQCKDVSFLGCAIQSTCRKSQLQIPCHILSPLHTLYRSVFSLSVVSLPLATSVVWSVWLVALWLSCGYGARKKRVYPGITADPGQHGQCSMPGGPLEASLQRCSRLGLFSSVLPL